VRDLWRRGVAWRNGCPRRRRPPHVVAVPATDRADEFLAGTNRWVQATTRIISCSERHPSAGIVVRYEDPVRFPDREMARVLRHLGGRISPSGALNARENRDIIARPHLGNVMGAVNDHCIGKGRAALPRNTFRWIVNMAAKSRVRLGYEPTGLDRCLSEPCDDPGDDSTGHPPGSASSDW
jgi:hypothetical protein